MAWLNNNSTGSELLNAAVSAYNNAVACHQQGRIRQAALLYRRALELDAGLAVAWHNCGSAHLDLGQTEQAVACYLKALEIDPGDYRSLYNLFICYQRTGKKGKALEIFREALPKAAGDWKLWNNLGVLFRDSEKLGEAEVCFYQALAIERQCPPALYNLGIIAQKKADYHGALAFFKQALQSDHEYAPAKWLYLLSLPMIYDDQQQIKECRARFASNLTRLSTGIDLSTAKGRRKALEGLKVTVNFFLQYQGGNDCNLMARWGSLVCRILEANYPEFSTPRPMPGLKAGERIRLGFVSSCMHEHTVGVFLQGWLQHLDKDSFEIYLYHVGSKTDRTTARLAGLSYKFNHIPEGCPRAAEKILADNLHILVHTDIGMNPATTLLAGLRLAPVQCKGWGHPVTTGLPTIDYYLSSDLMEPADAGNHYTEKLIRLPNLALAWQCPDLTGIRPDRNRFGIEKNAFVYLSTQSLFKYLPQHDDIYPRIARQVPQAFFVFIEAPEKSVVRRFKNRLAKAFSSHGLDMEKYCRFVPRLNHPDFMRLNLAADVLLDSLEWSGGKTTLEALCCGLPVVTLPGKYMRGRHAFAMLTMAGLTETIAASKQEYIRIAVRLGQDRALYNRIAGQTRSRAGLICNDTEFIRALEDFFFQVATGGSPNLQPAGSATVLTTDNHPATVGKQADCKAEAVRLQAEGRHREAAPLYRSHLKHCPSDKEAWFNLGVALHRQKRFNCAASACEKALALDPKWPEAWFNLADCLDAAGKKAEAVDAYRRCIKIQPNYGAAYYNLGLLLEQMEDFQEAAQVLKVAARLYQQAKIWTRLADVLVKAGAYNQAKQAYNRAIELDPRMWQAHNNLGNLYLLQDDSGNAIKCYLKVAKACPQLAQAHYNLGTALRLSGHFQQAEASFKQALKIDPDYAEAWNNLALTYKNQGIYDRALEYFHKAVQSNPGLAVARWNRAFVHLLQGNFKAGWQDFQWRFKIDRWKTIYPFRLDLPAWDGKKMPGTLFVHDEQGLGDTIQFVRYLELARKRCRRLVLETRPELVPILEGVAGIDRIVIRPGGKVRPRPEADAFIALMCLPRIFNTNLDSIPCKGPYITPPAGKLAKWRPRLQGKKFRVALVWAGRPQHSNDRNRSLDFRDLTEILDLDMDFVGLQKGPAGAKLPVLNPAGPNFVNLGPLLEDFGDTAAVLSLCDLVITVDTATAHLAGAMGRPCWVLIPFVPDWRWLLERSDSPWYPSLRLYRQQEPGKWQAVVSRIVSDLKLVAR